MGRRGSRARFLPDVYVFPGGAMEPQDARQASGTALREVYEETGLQLQQHLRSGGADGSAVLQILGRAITPTASPVRFHARFFCAHADHFEGALGGDGELQDLRWVPADNPDRLPLVDVTEFMLEELVRVLSGQSLGTPLMTYVQGRVRIRR